MAKEVDEKDKSAAMMGCLMVILAVPAMLIWWVLFGLILHKTEATTAEWSLYVAYLICSQMAFTVGAVTRVMFPRI